MSRRLPQQQRQQRPVDGADADSLAGAVGQNNSAADLLVSVAAVNAQTDVQLTWSSSNLAGLVLQASSEPRSYHILRKIDLLSSIDIVLAMFHVISSCMWSCGQCLPSTVCVSASSVTPWSGRCHGPCCSFQRSSVQVGHLGLGDLFHLSSGQSCNLFPLLGLPEAVLMPAPCRQPRVLVMKLKERSA